MRKRVYILTTVILCLDQISKHLVDSFINMNESVSVIGNFFKLDNIHNNGAAWGILDDKKWLLIAISLVALVILVKYMFQFKHNKRNGFAFGILFGGIIGNLLDRVLFGYVRDFLSFNIFGYHYPAFNVSDMAIVIGIGLLIIAIIKGEDKVACSSRTKHQNKD